MVYIDGIATALPGTTVEGKSVFQCSNNHAKSFTVTCDKLTGNWVTFSNKYFFFFIFLFLFFSLSLFSSSKKERECSVFSSIDFISYPINNTTQRQIYPEGNCADLSPPQVESQPQPQSDQSQSQPQNKFEPQPPTKFASTQMETNSPSANVDGAASTVSTSSTDSNSQPSANVPSSSKTTTTGHKMLIAVMVRRKSQKIRELPSTIRKWTYFLLCGLCSRRLHHILKFGLQFETRGESFSNPLLQAIDLIWPSLF